MPPRPPVLVLLLPLLAACAGAPEARAPAAASLHGDPARPAHARGWVRSELYFGLGPEGGAGQAQTAAIDEQSWRRFLGSEVTPRFPDGLSVFDAYGQWLVRGAAAPERLRTRVLVLLHEDTPRNRDQLDAIRAAWKQATGQESVLWSRHPVQVAF